MNSAYEDNERYREQVGLLIRALRSDLVSVHELAIVQLSLLGSNAISYMSVALSKAFEELNERNSRSNPELAIRGIVRVFGIVSDPSKTSQVIDALPRPQAVEALAKIGGEKALDAVISSMPKWYAEYLHLKEYSSGNELEPIDEFVKKIFELFGENGKSALREAMQTGPDENKELIAKTLAIVGDKNSVSVLLDTLSNGNEKNKAEAIRTLHKLRAKQAVPQMVSELLSTQDYDVFRALSEAILDLGNLDDWISVSFHRPKLRLRDGSGMGMGLGLRKSSSSAELFDAAIVKSGENAVPRLAKLLQDPDSSVQMEAAEMIAKIKRGEKEDPRSRYY